MNCSENVKGSSVRQEKMEKCLLECLETIFMHVNSKNTLEGDVCVRRLVAGRNTEKESSFIFLSHKKCFCV